MRIVRYLAVVAPTLFALLAVSQIEAAQIPSSQIVNASVAGPQTVWPPYTRTVTITVEGGPILTPALSSVWQTSVSDFATNDRVTWSVVLPADATDVTATVTGGTYQIGNSIEFSFTESVADFAWSYHTSQRVLRQGNQYQVDQYGSDNRGPFFYISTVFFASPYQYVGQIGPAPMTTGTSSAHWEKFVVLNGDNGRHIFSSSMWLADPRLARPDLKIIDKALTVETHPGATQAHVVAKIQNGGTITTGAPTYINIYDRKTPSSQPAGPLDLAGGWCSLDPLEQPYCPAFNSSLGITNALRIIRPGQVITLRADLTLTQPGLRDLWIQVDVLGGPNGLNLESEEANNWKYVGSVDNPYTIIYLPLIVKGR